MIDHGTGSAYLAGGRLFVTAGAVMRGGEVYTTPADVRTFPSGGGRENEGPRVVIDLSPGDAKTAAGLLLQHQPFGFTWEDVDTLRWVIASKRNGYPADIGPGVNAAALLTRAGEAVDRLAALLPPRDATPPVAPQVEDDADRA